MFQTSSKSDLQFSILMVKDSEHSRRISIGNCFCFEQTNRQINRLLLRIQFECSKLKLFASDPLGLHYLLQKEREVVYCEKLNGTNLKSWRIFCYVLWLLLSVLVHCPKLDGPSRLRRKVNLNPRSVWNQLLYLHGERSNLSTPSLICQRESQGPLKTKQVIYKLTLSRADQRV